MKIALGHTDDCYAKTGVHVQNPIWIHYNSMELIGQSIFINITYLKLL
ncbi:hypothetical protein acsn021_27100 [Anaerocolumna cellulosilytica]|uniref:Uncharacterized protein n=1 Tax=Anaerocolumna cellulosilytica TaxID=433286 RepID=A0A6S6R857_9FIRM|nr:hypothetical protein acsn021_27100 [Anaerocolumna cellulosilytica]